MEIDKNKIMGKLDSIGDEELKNIVRAIAESAGVGQRQTERVVSDIGKLRKSIGGLSDNDLQNALSMLDENTVNELKRQINK